MTEAQLKGILVKEGRVQLPHFVIIRHEDRFTHGIPDITFTGNKLTSWIEVKHATPNFQCKGIQELTMLRLALAGLAFFVVYWQNAGEKRTYLVNPPDIGKDPRLWTNSVEGFNHSWVIKSIRELHNDTGGS